MNGLKIIFAGSPAFAVPTLERLIADGKNVIAVITQPDKPAGRNQALTPTAVKVCAQKHGLPVYDYQKIRDHAKEIKSLGADIMITCAYGQLLTQKVLDCFPQGVWNIHASLLPKYRGASPIQAAILGGEEYTGVTVMKTELALDAGGILLVKRHNILVETCDELSSALSVLGAEAAAEAVALIERGQTQLLVQDEAAATYCKKISKEEAKIDFNDTAKNVERKIMALSSNPGAYCIFNGMRLKLLWAHSPSFYFADGVAGEVVRADSDAVIIMCGDGEVIFVRELQPAGGKRMSATDFANGRKIKAGDILD